MSAFFGSLTFAYPWLLGLLALLPAFYWLIRVTPPKPKSVTFSAVHFLLQLTNREESTISTPWWLFLTRLLIAALIIVALAQPRLNAPDNLSGEGPLVILIDNDWAAAPIWDQVESRVKSLLSQADREDRLVYLIPLASPAIQKEQRLRGLSPVDALEKLGTIEPVSWHTDPADLKAIAAELRQLESSSFHWITDGSTSQISAADMAETFQSIADAGSLTIYASDGINLPLVMGKPRFENTGLKVPLQNSPSTGEKTGFVLIKSATGNILTRTPFILSEEDEGLDLNVKLPASLYNEVDRLEIQGVRSVASQYLIDARSKRRSAGLVFEEQSNPPQALLSESHYIEKALLPFYTLQKGSLQTLMKADVSVIFLGDVGTLDPDVESALRRWIDAGGTLVRFSGPKFANASTELTPTRLRTGNRNLDGSISWTKPAALGGFPENSPFANLRLPNDVTVKKQVLAIPSVDLSDKTWAVLNDGTPLVTGDAWGEGHIVLFHTSATPSWSNLSLSGLFVEMLRDIGQLSRNHNQEFKAAAPLPPLNLRNGFGDFTQFKQQAEPLDLSGGANGIVSRQNPAGFYGTPDLKIALNLGDANFTYEPLALRKLPATLIPLAINVEINLQPNLLVALILLILFDLCLVLYLQGLFSDLKQKSLSLIIFAGALAASISLLPADAAQAEESLERIMEATLDTRLAFVITGDNNVDQLTAAGMGGLSLILNRRTSIETGTPMAIDLEKNELLFYPFVYWPITTDFPNLSTEAVRKINQYLKEGGTLLFDTRNQNKAGLYGGNIAQSPENIRLQQIVSRLHIPQLETVPVDHVLTRSFYLMQSFPGRYEAGNVWLSTTDGSSGNDGVSSVVIGSNDWAAAWALDGSGRPLVSVTPGGERQREQARRFGVNMAMYTLTGSYKADQVHIPAILDRLSQ